MKENRQDLTTGSIWGKMLFFSIPLVLTNLLQVLFNMADIAVIGQFAGSLSLGAVGSTTTLVTLFTGILIGMAGGINVLVARFFGAKDKRSTVQTIHTALLVSLAAGLIVFFISGYIFLECRRWLFTTLVMQFAALLETRRSRCIIWQLLAW